jgi:hypothetical protein
MSIIANRPAIYHRLSPRNVARGLAGVALLAIAAACSGSGGTFEPSERLNPAVKATLDTLMLDEWSAQARYAQVLQAFGNVSPFKALRNTHDRRATSLERIYLQFALFPPANPFRPQGGTGAASTVETGAVYDSRERACEVSVTLERETVDRYDRLLTLNPPRVVANAAESNRALALEEDIPAVQRCR